MVTGGLGLLPLPPLAPPTATAALASGPGPGPPLTLLLRLTLLPSRCSTAPPWPATPAPSEPGCVCCGVCLCEALGCLDHAVCVPPPPAAPDDEGSERPVGVAVAVVDVLAEA